MWFKIKLFFGKLWGLISVRWGLYYSYSRLVRWIVEHKHRKGRPPLDQYEDYPRLLSLAAHWKWRKDTWKVGWDSFSYPSRVQDYINRGVAKIGDCDDWSLYLGWVLKDIESRKPIFEHLKCENFRILTVTYANPNNGKLGGHNVCLIELRDKDGITRYAHSSNWDKGQIQSGFYDGRPYNFIEDIVRDITQTVCGKNGINMAWGTCDLKVKRTGEGGRVK